MYLQDLERQTLQAQRRSAEEHVVAEALAAAALEVKHEKIRQSMIDWMVTQGLDRSELDVSLTAEGGFLFLIIADHCPIYFEPQCSREEPFDVKGVYENRFRMDDEWGQPQQEHTLGDALVEARRICQATAKREQRDEKRAARKQALHAAKTAVSALWGQYYREHLETHPILRHLVDILILVSQDRARFENALEDADAWAVQTEARLTQKLENVNEELDRTDREVRALRYSLADEQDAHRETKAEHNRQGRGW